ncbi:proline-, glutamic acid- and leucine-rich protein 1 [Arctopsyche grandis]|uniref:proline-, glutamic acid- and leucine-rich protein 1 n=1 Tax=Arctopsyche grandis TaxID=121162 RepID=UPI00406D87E4
MSSLLGVWGSLGASGVAGVAGVAGGIASHRLLAALASHGALNVQSKDELQPIISTVTSFLSSGVTRSKGLLILKSWFASKVVLDDVLINHGHVWLPLCINTLKPIAVSVQEKALALFVIREILEASSKIHELERNVVSASLSDLVDNLTKIPPEIHSSALSCLHVLLSKHSKASGAHKTSIEKFIVQFLDCDNKQIVSLAAKCAHLLQQVRGGGEQGVNHKVAWRNQFELCIKSCHIIVKEIQSISGDSSNTISFFEDNNIDNSFVDTHVLKAQTKPFEMVLKNISTDKKLISLVSKDSNQYAENDYECNSESIVTKVERLMTRLENILIFIQALLVEPYPVAKQMKCITLLEVLLHCLSIKSKAINQEITLDSTAVILRAPELRFTVMRTIEALIICIREDIMPYSFLLLKMILQVLDESRTEHFSGGIKPYKNVRKAAYKSLSCLLSCLHTLKPPPQESDKGFEDHLLNNIIEDVSPFKTSMQLMVKNVGSLKQMSKKARRKLTMSQLESSNLPQNVAGANNVLNMNTNMTSSNNADLMVASLSCLESFFKSSGIFLKNNSHKLVQETLLKQIYDETSVPSVKEALCKTLFTIQMFQSHQQPSPLPFCLDVFSRHQHNTNFNLAVSSYTALINCMNVIRGSAPPICIPLVQAALNQTDTTDVLTDNMENGDIIDLDNYSNIKQNNADNAVLTTNDDLHHIHPNLNKRKIDDENFKGFPKISKSPSNDGNKNNEDEFVTMHIDIVDSSDSESGFIQERNTKIRKTRQLSATDDTINLINNLSDDDNNDVVCMESEVPFVNYNSVSTLENNGVRDEGTVANEKESIVNDEAVVELNDFFTSPNSDDNTTVDTHKSPIQNLGKLSENISGSQTLIADNDQTLLEDNLTTISIENVIPSEAVTSKVSEKMQSIKDTLNSSITVSVEEMMNSFVDEINDDFK